MLKPLAIGIAIKHAPPYSFCTAMNKFLDTLFAGKPAWIIFLVGLILLAIIGNIDYIIGNEISFFVFYVVPVVYAAWYGNKKLGLLFALMSAYVWFYAHRATGQCYSQAWIFFWNGAVRLTFFLLAAHWVSEIKLHLVRESLMARVDGLTGCVNSTALKQQCAIIFPLSVRFGSPLTLAYIDLDNFKKINDQRGHAEGDRVLQAVAATFLQSVRSTDVVARMGGDEFVILLPNTDIDDAKFLFDNLRKKLLECTRLNDWAIGFSIGVIAYTKLPGNIDDMIGRADALMYRVKQSGKNNILYETAN